MYVSPEDKRALTKARIDTFEAQFDDSDPDTIFIASKYSRAVKSPSKRRWRNSADARSPRPSPAQVVAATIGVEKQQRAHGKTATLTNPGQEQDQSISRQQFPAAPEEIVERMRNRPGSEVDSKDGAKRG